MNIKSRQSLLRHPDLAALWFAAVFLGCAVLSAVGAGVAALLAFVPAALCVYQVKVRRQSVGRIQRRKSIKWRAL